jgi:PAS domain S-box-containing protein
VYGGILCSLLNQIDYGYLFGKLATSLVEYQNNTAYDVRTSFVINSLIRHWKEPASASLDHALICYKNAIKIGDIEFASISVHVFCYMAFHTGRDLVGLEKEMKKYSDMIQSFHQEKFYQDNEMNRKCVLNLMGRSAQIFSITNQPDTDDDLLKRLKLSRDQKSIFSFYFNKLVLSYFFHDYQKAVDYADHARIYLEGVIGLYLYPLFIFFDSLARLAVFTSIDQMNQKRFLKNVRANQKKLKRWASHAPMNHMHKYYLVEAEKHRVIGKDVQASDFFEQAIQMAKTYQFIHEEALAYELAAKYYLTKGKTDLAKQCLLSARHCFMQWGAMAKVDHMDTRYHQLLLIDKEQAGRVKPDTLLTSTTSSALFDISTVMKASQAISTEIILDRLLERLMEVIIENAGAQKGFLILKNNDQLTIEAQISIASGSENKNKASSFRFQLKDQPIDECEDLSKSIVNYVARTGDNIVLGDATNDGLFTGDVYVMQHRPRSLLCIPIKRHQIITGILYLENNYSTDIFTVDRLEILQLLLSQAAISIENAKFYEQLEKRVEDRTRELQETLFALKHSEEKYRGLYQSSKDAIILLSNEFSIKNANDAALEISGYSLEELTQKSIRDITPEKWLDIEKKVTHEQVFKRGYSDEYEKEIIRKDGTLVPLSVRSWPLKDQDGTISGIWSIARDISERKRAERIREDVERIVRHDLKTPLNGIIGAASLFKNYDQLTKEKCEKWGFIIEKSAHNILHMIEHSLDVFKMEEGIYELEAEPCNLVPIFHQLRESLENLRSIGEQKLVFMMKDKPLTWDDDFTVMGEDIQLQNMFANLLKNALEASPDQETVTVQLNNYQKHNEITIHNMGVIPKAIRNHFFDRYATSGKSGGTGIGTYSALLIAKIHGGSISFKTSEKKGTTLIVHLPIHKQCDEDFSEKQISEGIELSDHSLSDVSILSDRRILLAEDNLINRSIFTDMLSNYKLRIDSAENGEDALELAKNQSYDAIFMDVQMPRMDGIEATKLIRKFDKSTPIIALTAHQQLEENDPCIEAGMNDFVPKPFHIDNLKRVLNQWLNDLQKNTPPAHTKQKTYPLPDMLPGINIHEALDRTSGYKNIFFELIDTFINQYKNIDQIISQLLKSNPTKAIEEAHSLKGAAANLSMPDIAKTAADLEKAIKDNSDHINEILMMLKKHMNIVLESIEILNDKR